ncbi:hypothetical protein [Bradyrhizobium symbiodeficiens]|uniref:Uncharacterized protein n=1 Tax=Bradyrhizobium symbiodeficiens TaxID=1404367 RepID=A0ABZ2F1Y7_9BRAD|nr:hypothetical protein [Bradyrhizobium symbiodeficiens]QIO98290.1 hypothetical protein HAU86_12450 [Bradyrhizobium symbiodeficiens]
MTFSENDREVMCLVNAFKEIKSRGKRRALLMLVEELAQNDSPLSPNKNPADLTSRRELRLGD